MRQRDPTYDSQPNRYDEFLCYRIKSVFQWIYCDRRSTAPRTGRTVHLSQDFHFGPARPQYTPALTRIPGVFCAEPCMSPPAVEAFSAAIARLSATEDGREATLTVHRLPLSPRRLEPEYAMGRL